MNQREDYCPKVCILGKQGVGKTRFFNRLLNVNFDDKPTIGANYKQRVFNIHPSENTKKIHFFDTSGQERFKKIINSYIQFSYLILVFNIDDIISFNYLTELKHKQTTNLVLIGTYIDNKESRKVTIEEAQQFALDNNMQYFEVSATQQSTNDEFNSILSYIIRNTHTAQKYNFPKSVPIFKVPKPENNECCNFILNVIINLLNIFTLFIPYLLISNCITHKKHYKENYEIRGNYFAFYSKNIKEPPVMSFYPHNLQAT